MALLTAAGHTQLRFFLPLVAARSWTPHVLLDFILWCRSSSQPAVVPSRPRGGLSLLPTARMQGEAFDLLKRVMCPGYLRKFNVRRLFLTPCSFASLFVRVVPFLRSSAFFVLLRYDQWSLSFFSFSGRGFLTVLPRNEDGRPSRLPGPHESAFFWVGGGFIFRGCWW